MSIVLATRAHYAALQHRKAPGRTRLNYSVRGGYWETLLMEGCIWVRVGADGTHTRAYVASRRKAELTKLRNRLRAMYPEASSIRCEFEG